MRGATLSGWLPSVRGELDWSHSSVDTVSTQLRWNTIGVDADLDAEWLNRFLDI